MRQSLLFLIKMLQSHFMNRMPKRETSQTIEIASDCANYDAQFEQLCARSFGPGRFAKAASLLRENNICNYQFSRSAIICDGNNTQLIGACRMWPIIDEIGNNALFLGPIVVDDVFRGQGIGAKLVRAVLEQTEYVFNGPIILVGDMSFFGQFGFAKVPLGQIILPAPVNPERLLWRGAFGSEFCGKIGRPQ